MRYRKPLLALLVFAVGLAATWGQITQTNQFTGVNLPIPDGDVNGVQDTRSIASNVVQISSLRVRLEILGQFNGDLYGYLRHSSGSTTHIGVLLNRPGRTATNSYGYADRGLNVTLDDLAAHDIHTYRDVTNPPLGTPLYGTWQPDARFVDPTLATTTSPRAAFLSEFEGLSAGGEWTLFLADVDGGATNFLRSWGLEIAGKARPAISWTNPPDILQGTALDTNQLNATADVPGNFVYDPPAGTLLPVGSNQTLSVTFLPADTNSYIETTASVTLTVRPVVSITGVVRYYPTNYPSVKRVAGVTLSLGGDTNGSVTTLSDGSYSVAGVEAGGTYGVTPGKTNDSPTANGVTTLDIALIRQHILSPSISTLTTPYKLLAADVNGSGAVTTLDIAFIRQVVLNSTNRFPAGLWRFIPADHGFANPNSPWSAPTNRWYTNLMADLSGEDFVGIKLGDVNDSWVMPAGGSSLAVRSASRATGTLGVEPDLRLEVGEQSARSGERVRVGIRVSGFRQVTSAQFTLGWDATVLRYVGIGNYGLRGMSAGSFGTTRVEGGSLMCAWDDPAVEGVTVADGEEVVAVDFEVVGAAGSGTVVALGDVPTARETSVNCVWAALSTQNGKVNVVAANAVRVSEAAYKDGTFRLSVPTENGRRYVLECTDTLPAIHWTALSTIEGDGTLLTLTDPAATNTHRFFRVRVE